MKCNGNVNNCKDQYVVEIVPLYNKNLRSLIESLSKLKYLYIKVKTSYLEEAEDKGKILSILRRNFTNIKEIGSKTVTLEIDSGKSRNEYINVIEPIDIIHLLNELSADAFVKIRLRAINREDEYVRINDLLSKFIKEHVDVEYADNLTRRVNSETMFSGILASFRRLFDSIIDNVFT